MYIDKNMYMYRAHVTNCVVKLKSRLLVNRSVFTECAQVIFTSLLKEYRITVIG
jgi:hypothetical protein